MVGLAVEVNLTTFGPRDTITLTYGGGTGGHDKEGAEAQAAIGDATFVVESHGGSDDDVFVDISDDDDDAADTYVDPLTIDVKGAESGSGEGAFEIMSTSAGRGALRR